jgi:hypothetical protein
VWTEGIEREQIVSAPRDDHRFSIRVSRQHGTVGIVASETPVPKSGPLRVVAVSVIPSPSVGQVPS